MDALCGLRSAVDTVHGALVIAWGEAFERNAVPILQACQEAARNNEPGRSYFQAGGQVFRVRATGGGRGKGVYRHWIVEGAGVRLEISRCSAEGSDYWNGVWSAGSVACHSAPVDKLLARVCCIVEALGGRVLADSVSRLDICVDVAQPLVSWFMQAHSGGRIVTRAKQATYHLFGQRIQTVRIGSRLQLRVYDKLAELRAKPDEAKKSQLAEEWGGQLPDDLTRFEYQVPRHVLRDMGIRSVADVVRELAGVGKYLSESWLRVCDKVDRENPQRSPVSQIWQRITAEFQKLGERPPTVIRRAKAVCRDSAALVRQGIGCFLAAIGGQCLTFGDFLSEVQEGIRREVSAKGRQAWETRLGLSHAEAEVEREGRIYGRARPVSASGVLHQKRVQAGYCV